MMVYTTIDIRLARLRNKADIERDIFRLQMLDMIEDLGNKHSFEAAEALWRGVSSWMKHHVFTNTILK